METEPVARSRLIAGHRITIGHLGDDGCSIEIMGGRLSHLQPDVTAVRFRLTRRQRSIWLIAGVLQLVPAGLVIVAGGGAFRVLLLGYPPILYGLIYLMQGRFGVDLLLECAVARGARRRIVSWDRVQAIEARRWQAIQVIVLVEPDRRSRLRAPATGFLYRDPRFDEKLATIRSWWLDHRGPDALELTNEPVPTSRWMSVWQILQQVATGLLGLYALLILLVIIVTAGRHGTIRLLSAEVPPILIACLLEPIRPHLLRALRKSWRHN